MIIIPSIMIILIIIVILVISMYDADLQCMLIVERLERLSVTKEEFLILKALVIIIIITIIIIIIIIIINMIIIISILIPHHHFDNDRIRRLHCSTTIPPLPGDSQLRLPIGGVCLNRKSKGGHPLIIA